MQLLEQLAYGHEIVNETMFPNAKAKKIWFGEKCKEGRQTIKDANTLYKNGARKEAKEKYIYAKGIFTDLRKEFAKLSEEGGGVRADVIHGLATGGALIIPFANIGAFIYITWQICRDYSIEMEIGKVLKLRENDVKILDNEKDYDVDEPTYVKYMLGATDDIIYYCGEMIKKCK